MNILKFSLWNIKNECSQDKHWSARYNLPNFNSTRKLWILLGYGTLKSPMGHSMPCPLNLIDKIDQ